MSDPSDPYMGEALVRANSLVDALRSSDHERAEAAAGWAEAQRVTITLAQMVAILASELATACGTTQDEVLAVLRRQYARELYAQQPLDEEQR